MNQSFVWLQIQISFYYNYKKIFFIQENKKKYFRFSYYHGYQITVVILNEYDTRIKILGITNGLETLTVFNFLKSLR